MHHPSFLNKKKHIQLFIQTLIETRSVNPGLINHGLSIRELLKRQW